MSHLLGSQKQLAKIKCPLINLQMFIYAQKYANRSKKGFLWMKVVVAQLGLTLRPYGLWPARLLCPWNSSGKNTGVGCHSLLQGIFPNQGLNPGLPHCRQILYQLSHKGSPRILEWVAYPFSSGSSWPRDWSGVSCIAGGFFTIWAIREDKTMFSSI